VSTRRSIATRKQCAERRKSVPQVAYLCVLCGKHRLFQYAVVRPDGQAICKGSCDFHAARKHGASSTPTYKTWKRMRSRCNDLNNPMYVNYGGRGITVCERWDSFELFLQDMGQRPSPDYSLDRIDNELGYFPQNCRWADRVTQARNRRSTIMLVVDGVRKSLIEWATLYDIGPITIQHRIKVLGWTVHDAVCVPPRSKPKAKVTE
jgi:hypothetical protein